MFYLFYFFIFNFDAVVDFVLILIVFVLLMFIFRPVLEADMVSYQSVKFQLNRLKHVRVRKWNFKMAAILFFQIAPILNALPPL